MAVDPTSVFGKAAEAEIDIPEPISPPNPTITIPMDTFLGLKRV
jgi:hypothetical protein